MSKEYNKESDGALVTLESLKKFNELLKETGLGGAHAEEVTDAEVDAMFQGVTPAEGDVLKETDEASITGWLSSLEG